MPGHPIVRPSKPPNAQLDPNCELSPGDHFIIRKWCRGRSYVRLGKNPLGGTVALGFSEEQVEGSIPNTAMEHDVLRVEAVQYPSIVATYWTTSGTGTCQLDARDFECELATPAFADATKAAAGCGAPAPVAQEPAPARRWWKPWTWRAR